MMNMPTAQRPSISDGKIAYADLPYDMQTLIAQFITDYDPTIDIPARLPLGTIPVAGLPRVPLDRYDRGRAYALAMDLNDTPPLIIAGGQFLDGKHRVYAARAKAVKHLPAIDLSGIAPAYAIESNAMGRARGFVLNGPGDQ
jgi:hypothetical protein